MSESHKRRYRDDPAHNLPSCLMKPLHQVAAASLGMLCTAAAVVSTLPVVRVIQPHENIPTILNAATPGEHFALVAGQHYDSNGQINPKAGGWSLNGNGAHVSIKLPAGTRAWIRDEQPNVTIANLNLQGNGVTAFGIYAEKFSVSDCTIASGMVTILDVEPGGTHCTATRINAGRTASCTAYTCESYTTIDGWSAAGSDNEATFRQSPANGVTPTGLTIQNCEVWGGGANKGAIEVRQGLNSTLKNNRFHDYIRLSQSPAESVGQYVHTALLTGNTWDHPLPGRLQIHLLFEPGCDAVVSGNTFAVDATMQVSLLAPFDQVTFANNTRQMTTPGKPRPTLWGAATKPGQVIIAPTEGGTVDKAFVSPAK